MGFSQVVAAAILLVGSSASAFHLAGRAFDTQRELHEDWREGAALQAEIVQTSFAIAGVSKPGATVRVDLENTGSATLDASLLTLLVDGVPTAVATWQVEGVATDVWPPGTSLRLTATAPNPAHVLVAAGNGVTAVWRA